jgi:Zn-dependent protease
MQPIQLGTVRGIPIRLRLSALVLPALLAYLLATQTLPVLAPGRPTGSYLLGGALAGGCLLASLLAHETAHALVALRYGVRTRSITLSLLGGTTELETETAEPLADLQVAVAGPATSAALGGLAIGAGAAVSGVPVLGDVLTWLGWANLVLAVFNLLPGAPLDGGRIVRALLWWRTGDRLRASVITGWIGTGLGTVLLVVGAVELLRSGPFGLWTILIGAFIANAGRREQAVARLRLRVRGLRVADLMTRDVVAGPDWLSVHAFVERVVADQVRPAYPLLDADGRYTGILLASQLATVPAAAGGGVRVLRIAVPAELAPPVGPDEPVNAVLDRLGGRVPSVVPVIDAAGVPVGLLAAADVVRAAQHRPAPAGN